MIQLTDAHAHIKNEKQAMERITLGIPTMACAVHREKCKNWKNLEGCREQKRS